MYFCDLRALVRKLASPFGHPTQVSTQVQLASTCNYLVVLWPGLYIQILRFKSFKGVFMDIRNDKDYKEVALQSHSSGF